MKFLIKFLILMLCINLILVIFFDRKKDEFSNEYKVNEFTVNEQLKNDLYIYNISNDDIDYSFEVKNIFDNDDKTIIDTMYMKGSKYSCVLPIFKDSKILFDFVCTSGSDEYYYYHDIVSNDKMLDGYMSSNTYKTYSLDNFIDKELELKYDNSIFYPDNMKNNLIITNYKGIIKTDIKSNKFAENINLFDKDVYLQRLKIIYNDKYILADYNELNNFSNIIIVDLKNNTYNKMNFNKKISFNSIFQGIVDDYLYIIDLDDKKQYKYDLLENKMYEVGNVDKKFKFYNLGKWEDVIFSEASKEFNKKNSLNNYEFVSRENYFDVYKVTANTKQYLFKTSNNNIKFYGDDIYYLEDDILYYFNPEIGNRKIYSNKELIYNNTIDFYIIKE